MVNFEKITTIPIKERINKVSIDKNFAKIEQEIELLPNPKIERLANKIVEAHLNNKKVVLMMGAHVIKTGMSPYIIDLLKKRIINHVALNGAGSIHDFEIAMIGETSESVEDNIENGTFGMSEETGAYMNEALITNQGGYGAIIGKTIEEKDFEYKDYSILYNAHKLRIPVTVHVAIGTDIIHQHPACEGEAIGRTSYEDFKIFTETISKLNQGVIINLGSAVILPEVFLKSLTVARNLKYDVFDITAANLDMIEHYRPRVNVVERPTSLGGEGLNILEKHEKSIPTLYKLIMNKIKEISE